MSIEVVYRFPPGTDAEKQAKVIAVGQTAGTWNARFSHCEESFRRHLATVVAIETAADGSSRATIRFPEENLENDVPSLLTAIFGKYSMAGAAKVVEVRLPEAYGRRPGVGMSGIRDRLGVQNRPLVMAIFKPALGLPPEEYARILAEVAAEGLDIIKDDEIVGNVAAAPTLERLQRCREVLERVRQSTGRTLLYAVNVTADVAGTPLETARQLVRSGANALLLNVLTYGFGVLEAIAADPDINVPVFAHPALAGALCAAPNCGLAYSVVLGTLMARAGADAVLYPARYGSLPFEAEEESKIRDALRSRNVFPVPSAGIRPGIVPQVLQDYGNDVVLNAGTGIMDHPDGPGAGVQAFFEAIARVENGESFELESLPAGALRRAIEKWG